MKGISVSWNIRNQLTQPVPCVLSIAPGTTYSTVDQNGNEIWRSRVQVFGSAEALAKARQTPQPTMGTGAIGSPGSSIPALEEFDLVDMLDQPGTHPVDLMYAELVKRYPDAQPIETLPAVAAE